MIHYMESCYVFHDWTSVNQMKSRYENVRAFCSRQLDYFLKVQEESSDKTVTESYCLTIYFEGVVICRVNIGNDVTSDHAVQILNYYGFNCTYSEDPEIKITPRMRGLLESLKTLGYVSVMRTRSTLVAINREEIKFQDASSVNVFDFSKDYQGQDYSYDDWRSLTLDKPYTISGLLEVKS